MKNVFLSLLIFWAIALPLLGQQRPNETKPAAGISVGELLKPDGTLDLSQGHAGTLDLSGYAVTMTENGPQFSSRSSSANDNDNWTDIGGGLIGADSQVEALITEGNTIYIGGWFDVVGNVVANRVAKWNGSQWSALGDGLPNKRVFALASDGNGGLYAGGEDENYDGFVAYWNGTNWTEISTSANFNARVFSLFPTSNGLYVGGSFSMQLGSVSNYISYWDGTSWSGVGGSGVNSTVYSIISDGNGGLYIGGDFFVVGGDAVFSGSIPANKVAHWNGTNWSAVGNGLFDTVLALALDGTGGLIAGGEFESGPSAPSGPSTPIPMKRLARWDGTAWSEFANGINGTQVNSIIADGQGGLYVGGDFNSVGGVSSRGAAYWNGSAWTDLATANDFPSFVKLAKDASGNLYAGGRFNNLSGNSVDYVAKWNGSAWEAMNSGTPVGLGQFINAVVLDGNGGLYAGGQFSVIGGIPANNVAHWNGSQWSALGEGTAGTSNGVHVTSLALDQNGGLYVGGGFTSAGGNPASRLAYWNGSSWSEVGGGLTSGFARRIFALLPDGNGGLYVGGRFTGVGGNTIGYIAHWNGTTWAALGGGVNNNVETIISDGNGGIIVGGSFTMAGGNPANRVAQWNGTSWTTFGNGIPGTVYALAFDSNGRLYAGGEFNETFYGAGTPNYLTYWDGTNWQSVNPSLNTSSTSGYPVRSLLSDGNGGIFVGGRLINVGTTKLYNIAHWDGANWSNLGNGVNRTAYTLVDDGNGSFYAGGDFTAAGSKASALIAKYTYRSSPLAAFTQSATTIVEGQSVSFDASGSTGENLAYSWNFAGGTPATATTVNPTIAYNVPGNYTVSLTVTEGSNTHTSNGTVEVWLTAPTGVAVTANSASSLTVTWADNTQHETGYEIVRSSVATENATTGFATVDATYTVGPNVTTFTDTNLAAGMTYYYRVRAVKN